jgi:hypothetical protein
MKRLLLAIAVVFPLVARGADDVVVVSVEGLGSSYLQRLLDWKSFPTSNVSGTLCFPHHTF